jgi:peptidoglycan/LPS O-acetylase OafA/YrhL
MSVSRISVLDSFRAIAALSVLFFHIATNYFPYGHFGVQFFFIISGFVIFKTIERCNTVVEFAVKRFFRLYPTYWFCLLLTTLLINITYRTTGFNPVSVKLFFYNLTMIQEVLGSDNVDHSYWSLVPELFFYVFISAVFFFRQMRNIQWIGILWLALITANAIFNIEGAIPYIRFFNIRHGQLFFAGIVLYQLYSGKKHWILKFNLALCYLVSLLVYSKMYTFPVASIAVTIIFTCFVLFLKEKLNFLANPVLQFIGLVSYPLYLIHQQIGYIINKLLTTYLGLLPIVLITTLFFVFIAYLIYKLVELPSAKLTKYVLSRNHKYLHTLRPVTLGKKV